MKFNSLKNHLWICLSNLIFSNRCTHTAVMPSPAFRCDHLILFKSMSHWINDLWSQRGLFTQSVRVDRWLTAQRQPKQRPHEIRTPLIMWVRINYISFILIFKNPWLNLMKKNFWWYFCQKSRRGQSWSPVTWSSWRPGAAHAARFSD